MRTHGLRFGLSEAMVIHFMGTSQDKTSEKLERCEALLALNLRKAADVLAAVQAQTDADRLSQWFDLLLAGATLDQFRTALTP